MDKENQVKIYRLQVKTKAFKHNEGTNIQLDFAGSVVSSR